MAIVLVHPAAAFAAPKLKVVTTTTDLKSIFEAGGGDKVEVASLGSGREDPHFIDAKPSYMVLAKDADLWVRIGMELEIGYEGLVLDGARNPKIRIGTPGHLDASEGVIRLEVPTGKVDRSMGDIHPLGNPHYWLDPLNVRIVAKNVAARLSQLDSADAEYFKVRLEAYQKKLDAAMFGPRLMSAADGAKLWAMLLKGQLDDFVKQHGGDEAAGGWWGALRPLAGTKIVTYHRSWTYFANRFNLNVIDELEPKPGIPPSPAHLADVVEKVQREGAKFLLMEPFYSREAPDWLASKTGIKVVEVANSVGGQSGATDYISLMDLIVKRCVEVAGSPTAVQP
ncbi:MAG TPA: metal ABC transporter substrate-binding protein [Phycisphaerae bacterium]